jgi:ribosomal protein L35
MPHSFKTKKALSKRVKITSRGKLMKRPPNQNHFNARESGQGARDKKGFINVPRSLQKSARELLGNF